MKKGSAVQPCRFQSLPAIVFHVDAVPICGYVSHEVSKCWKLLHETVHRLFQNPPALEGSTYVAKYQGSCSYPVTFPYALVLNHAFRTDISPFGSASVPQPASAVHGQVLSARVFKKTHVPSRCIYGHMYKPHCKKTIG